MAEIFLSYASEDRESAASLASALEANGWSVWWDRRIIAGETFDAVIERELADASCVVVLWSDHSVQSEWVRNEAAAAMERDVLVPVRIESVKPPLEFRRRHTLDLVNWIGGNQPSEFEALLKALASVTQKKAAPKRVAESRAAPFAIGKYSIIALATVMFVGLSFAIYNAVKPNSAGEHGAVNHSKAAKSSPTVERLLPKAPNSTETPSLSKAAGLPEESAEVIELSRGTVDDPEIIDFNKTYRVKLGKNEESFLQLSSAASGLMVVVDLLLSDYRNSNIQGTVSVLDADGVIIANKLVSFNEIDTSFRKLGNWSAPAHEKYGLKLLHKNSSGVFFVTVMKPENAHLVPFLGSLNPVDISLEAPVKGQLEKNRRAFYAISLAAGSYKAIIDFVHTNGAHTNIQGYLAVLNSLGGEQEKIVSFNEIGVSHRKSQTFSLEEDTVMLFKIGNSSGTISYTLNVREQK